MFLTFDFHQISALDVERVLLQHPDISEIAVVGYPDVVYEEKIAAILVTSKRMTLTDIQNFCKERLPQSSIPDKLIVVESIPRNALGKVNKVELKKEFFPSTTRVHQSV